MADYIYMMESRLTPEQQRGVTLVQEAARAHGMNVYLVGGVVRDIISGASIRDLDFAVQGNALKLQRDLEKTGAIVQGSDETLRTLYVMLPGNLRGEIASARSEAYDKPGKPPEITPATINEDVRHRDFTFNAMALSLNPGSRGLLLDPYNGVADIEGKHIRILHNYAFLEDPSRLVRATRFMARHDWTMEERTQARYQAAKENGYIEHINKKLIGHEIEQIAHETDPIKVMRALDREGWLKVLHPHWSVAKVDTSGLNHLLKIRQQIQDAGYTVDAGPAVMYFLTDRLNSNDVAALQSAIQRKAFVTSWKHLEDAAKDFARRLAGKEAATNSQAWKLLSATAPETVLFTAATSSNKAAVRKIQDFLTKWRQIKSRFPLPEMAPMRITPELPEYPKLVEDMFLLMLDGKLKTQPEIIKYLTPYSPPEPEPPPPPPRRGRVAKKGEKEGKGKRGKKAAAAGTTVAHVAAGPLKDVADAVGAAVGKALAAAKAVVAPALKHETKKPAPAGMKPAMKVAAKPAAKPAAKAPKPSHAQSKPAAKKKAAKPKPQKPKPKPKPKKKK